MKRLSWWLVLAGLAPFGNAAELRYPATERGDQVNVSFGISVADPYRWLESDVRSDARVRAWVEAQNAVTQAYLAGLPERASIERRLRELWNFERRGVPLARGSRLFFTRNAGLQSQAVLYVQEGVAGAPRMLLDPNTWSKDGATALGDWLPSDDGRFLAYAVQDGGSDWSVIRLVDVSSGKVLPEELEWVKFSRMSWSGDGTALYYSRFPAPPAGAELQAPNLGMAVYRHVVGTAQAADRKMFDTPEKPTLGHTAEVCDEGRWLVLYTGEGTDDRYEVTVWNLAAPSQQPRTLFSGMRYNWYLAGCEQGTLYFRSNHAAPRYRLVAVDAASGSESSLREVVPQSDATLVGASRIGERLVLRYLQDVRSEVRVFSLAGKPVGRVALPGIGTVEGFEANGPDAATYFSYASFDTPPEVYRYDSRRNVASAYFQPQTSFDRKAYEVRQLFYSSRDGTRVPMFVARKRSTRPLVATPALLYGYGGFNSLEPPFFSAANLAWMEMGGVFAVAHIRGGGEYGDAWHDGGRLLNKQNVFDDFIAAAEHLVRTGVTTPSQLAIIGDSNGGLLVGAVVNQRPDLFAAALPGVGVMDMLRFTQFTAGRYWVDDYGDPAEEAHFRNLLKYSPYHNVRDGVRYPAILVTTADTDDRVVPGHSFKYAAALQAADIGSRPHLIRIETRAGHGSGKPTDKAIQECADMWAFIGHFTGLTGERRPR